MESQIGPYNDVVMHNEITEDAGCQASPCTLTTGPAASDLGIDSDRRVISQGDEGATTVTRGRPNAQVSRPTRRDPCTFHADMPFAPTASPMLNWWLILTPRHGDVSIQTL
ncbi:hypothetical protein FHS43_000076 [Streptosporangium becharense]|uniref:Uncharacterized protein n=1 Tax=Streptosporangium becharense TaxID=1816182 RepID=A0A7W9MGI4_9ACTN|nr:hypothetical protein [Streptosporangium becharense]MBB2908830.1 hypothetical protein [Streptosporangium becharense]MBB5820152.1 hypothetical protein [Streptosporangium becharense]